jgi:L-fuconolactonase
MPASVVDAHQHFWRYQPERLPWIPAGSIVAADYLPADLEPLLAAGGVGQTIAVQVEHDEAETRWLLELTAHNDWIAGVVGWVDLQAEDVAERLDRLAHPKLVGLRHLVQDEASAEFLVRPAFVRGVREAARRGLTYDILVFAHQAALAPRFIEAVGEGSFVLDHGAKPNIRDGGWEPWATSVAAIAAFPNVWCKISGLVTEADPHGWKAEDIEPYLDHLLTSFGPERLIFASDWPVCGRAATYAQVKELAEDFVQRRCPAHARSVFGGAARAAYKLQTRE